MAGQRSLNSNVGGLLISNLADEHHIRVCTKDRTQSRGERHTGLVVHLNLIDASHTEFHRVLNRNDVDFRTGHITQRGIQRGRLTRTGRTGDQHQTIRTVVRLGEHVEITLAEIQILHLEIARRRAQDSHNNLLAPYRRQCGHTKIHLLTIVLDGDTTILRLTALADIHIGHDLDAADHTLGHGFRRLLEHVQHTVDTVAHEQTVFLRFDVDIGAVVVDGLVDK